MTGEQSRFSRFAENVEETFIAITLGIMTVITFANVVARYIFNSNILWALELTLVLFAWLGLVGAAYGIKKRFHIGVDVIINVLPAPAKKVCALLAVSCSLIFALMLLKGAWDYWLPFATDRIWMETDDLPVPSFLAWIGPIINEGEADEKMPRFVTYFALPLGMSLLVFRLVQAGYDVLTNKRDSIIAAHEVEEMLEEVTDAHADGHHHNADRAAAKANAAAQNKNKEH